MSETADKVYEQTRKNQGLTEAESTLLEKVKSAFVINKYAMGIVMLLAVVSSVFVLSLNDSSFYLKQLIPAYVIVSLVLIQVVTSKQK